jgi:selenocysteine-specific elongation factor
LGGGVIVDPHSLRRWKRFDVAVLRRLEVLLGGSLVERLLIAASAGEPKTYQMLFAILASLSDDFDSVFQRALSEGLLVEVGAGSYWSRLILEENQRRLKLLLFHDYAKHPLHISASREEIRQRLGLKSAVLSALLATQDEIIEDHDRLKLRGRTITFSANEQETITTLMNAMRDDAFMPPSTQEAINFVGEDVFCALLELGEIVQVQPEVVFSRAAYQTLLDETLNMLHEQGRLTVAEVRDHFSTSRKYAIAFLEYLDQQGITQRQGDVRVRVPAND